jgi:hypothetical protein
VVTPTTWVLHAAWLVVLAVWAAAAWHRARTSAGEAPAPTGQPPPPVRRLRVREN